MGYYATIAMPILLITGLSIVLLRVKVMWKGALECLKTKKKEKEGDHKTFNEEGEEGQ